MGLLEGKVAFITGAARGQGRSHAVRLAEEGASIIATDACAEIDVVPYPLASEEELGETADLVRKAGGAVTTAKADVRRFPELKAAVAAGLREFGHIDIVLANAGIATMGVDLSDDEVEAAWDAVIDINLKGVWNTVRACAPPMIERGQGGAIVLTSSTAGLKGLTSPGAIGHEGYGASKHGVVGLMRQFAVELSTANIRVNTVHPTGVNTMMVNNAAMEKFLSDFPDATASITNLLDVELLQPRDISDAIVFLVSDQAKWITGVTLPVDAGFTVK
ncbi:MAG TPA: mycofactocin-coupled SDR family oxidoreductase [Acidimicrobiales bacterium]|nr:mycofactocin-coupled SDR family oxidoreductase [Acidimicrobiales bacterium]